jgi:guanine nucleotide-binding protein G(i) subunit alpha
MADPLTIIGTVGALCNIIDVVSKTIKTTNTWRMRRKDSDLYLTSLASQLISLRAALNKIQVWMDAEADEAHYQLEMDLDMAISCCKILVDKLEMAFRPFKKSVPGSWDVLAKLKMILGTTGLDELQKLLEQQTSALNLLLTACNW